MFDTETDIYELTFDDQAISYDEMQRIAWLSPLIDPTLPHVPFMMGTQRVVPDKVEKIVMALPLETCLPGYEECQTPTLDAAFLRNAADVLKKTRGQLQLLETESLPAVLEPVRSYLVFTLKTTLDWTGAEYAYLRDSNMAPARAQFCQYCSCSGDYSRVQNLAEEKSPNLRGSPTWQLLPGLLDRMAAETDPKKRLQLATHDFPNVLMQCFAAHDPGYPMQAWKDFLTQYRIQEVWKQKSIP
ncbi:MAG: hypothetical protein JO033_25915 [Acidobacteriaceae bacterium]|nr:hypothetical protein [Acidobacteriaceae bacterium]MBV9499294.1 hypothetical protein [Acidobacteriaceae bacterium]